MATNLSPLQAAQIANAVYNTRITDEVSNNFEERQQDLGLNRVRNAEGGFSGSQIFTGNSGYNNVKTPTLGIQNIAIKKGQKVNSGFGFFAIGDGVRNGEAIVATRGTATMSDVLTDLWAAPKPSPMGSSCHSGFIDTFQSYLDELKRFADDAKNSVSTVHCVGHSLGGALASLNAEYLALRGFNVNLYTFGSPRVGFGKGFTNSLKGNKVKAFRAYNDGDPVPMVPCWPFVHTEGDSRIGSQFLITPGAHSMDSSYIPSARGFSTWDAINRTPDPHSYKDLSALQSTLKYSKSMANSTLKVIMYILKKLVRTAEVILGVAVIATLGTLDLLAYLLHKAASLTNEFRKSLSSLLKGIMKFLGRAVGSAVNMTEHFIRFILDQLFSVLSNKITLAIIASLAAPHAAAMPLALPFSMLGAF